MDVWLATAGFGQMMRLKSMVNLLGFWDEPAG